ncbi:hypothetical protein B0H13DRAFT_813653 [Mycena leptocephala]|nr:hypothetical protein B0H13DRAFT_813653 [Mycena leptocephala]
MDTSTWRRSNSSPVKVLCNKCGLFERTDSCPRPEQFPHKRGPLASFTLRSRSPPQAQPYQTPAHYPPPGLAPRPTPRLPPRTPLTTPLISIPRLAPKGPQNRSASHSGTPNPKRPIRVRCSRSARRRGMGEGRRRSASGMRGGSGVRSKLVWERAGSVQGWGTEKSSVLGSRCADFSFFCRRRWTHIR